MLIVWGRYAMQHPRDSAVLERCGACSAEQVERRTVERVWHFMSIPLVPGAMRSATVCGNCKHLELAKLARGAAPPRRMLWRVLVTWALLAAVAVLAVLASRARSDRARAWAAAPALGDRWVVDLPRWPSSAIAKGYGLIEVAAVDQGEVSLGGCEYASDADSGPPASSCKTFPMDMPAVKVADVPGLLDRGAIVSIRRPGQRSVAYETAAGLLLLLAIAGGILTWRAARKSWKPGDRLPRAAVVR